MSKWTTEGEQQLVRVLNAAERQMLLLHAQIDVTMRAIKKAQEELKGAKVGYDRNNDNSIL